MITIGSKEAQLVLDRDKAMNGHYPCPKCNGEGYVYETLIRISVYEPYVVREQTQRKCPCCNGEGHSLGWDLFETGFSVKQIVNE